GKVGWRAEDLVVCLAELVQMVERKREDRWLDIFGSGDVGQVWGDNRSQTNPTVLANNDFNSSNWRSAIGGGVQFRYNKNLAARIEIGHSNERNLVFASITRGF